MSGLSVRELTHAGLQSVLQLSHDCVEHLRPRRIDLVR
jgi:hypothetical protein